MTKISRSKSGIAGLAAILIVGLFVVLFAAMLGFITLPSFNPPTTQTSIGITPSTPATGAPWTGSVSPDINGADTIATGTSWNPGAALSLKWLRNVGAGGIPSTGYTFIANNNASWTAIDADNGIMFLTILGNSPATLYIDIARTLSANPSRFEGYAFVDYNGDVTKDHLFRVNFGAIRPTSPGETNAKLAATVFAANYQAPTLSVLRPTASPETGVGTSANLTKITLTATFSNFDRAYMVKQIKVMFNTTNTAKFKIEQVIIPVRGGSINLVQGNFAETVATNSTYVYEHCADLSCISSKPALLYSQTGVSKTVDITVQINFKLATSDTVVFHFELNAWDDDEAGVKKQVERNFKA